MNILKHKSWHVYNKTNIEKVRRDEQQAAEEQEKRDAKAQLAEQERRIALLRDQKHKREDVEVDKDDDEAGERPSKATKLDRFSLFDEPTTSGTNAEYEEDKRKEKEKLERQYTMYLGQDRNGPPKIPWYLQSKEDREKESGTLKKVDEEKTKRDLARQKRDDPMAGHLSSSNKASATKALPPPSISTGCAKFDIQKLREQRLKREASERVKTSVLMNSGKIPEDVAKHKEDDKYYHSQFNPEFVRRPAPSGGGNNRRNHDRDSGEGGSRSRHNVRFT